MPGSNQEIADLFFKHLQGDEFLCSCGVKHKQAANKGVTKLMSHITTTVKNIKKFKHRKAHR